MTQPALSDREEATYRYVLEMLVELAQLAETNAAAPALAERLRAVLDAEDT
jgi:hypothetical protein